MQPEVLLQYINAQHQTTFTLLERCLGGEQGAFLVTAGQEGRFVLKWSEGLHQVEVVNHIAEMMANLRANNYPAPLYLYNGVFQDGCYSIQERLPGTPMQPQSLTRSLVQQVCALNRKQRNAANERGDWPQRIVETVLHGGDGYCLLAPLRDYSSETANMLSDLQTYVRMYAPMCRHTMDIVHYDFNPANILMTGGQISGVIDWDGTCVGDAGFDLATMLFYQYKLGDMLPEKAIDDLMSEACAYSGVEMVHVYLAHMVVRQLDWSIRHHAQSVIDHYLDISREICSSICRK
jgi:hypothetical protein